MRVSASIPAVPGNYINQVKAPGEFLVAYEMGSLALTNPAGGLLQQLWTLKSDGTRIILSSPTQPPFVILTDVLITEIDLAFDQDMFPFITYVSLGIVKFYWFDPTISKFVTSILSEFAISPRCTLDDKRPFDVGNSDIVLMYIDPVVGQLAYRLQRDRYETINLLGPVSSNLRVQCVNFADTQRLQWTLNDVTPVYTINLHKGMNNFTRPISIAGAYKT